MKFKPSIAFDEFSGSAGNVTAAKINGRSYIKRKPIPTNPNTEKQQEVRNRFKEIAKAYKALTQEKKNAWELHSKKSFSRAIFGVKATLSGIWQGVVSLRGVKNTPMFLLFTIGIWASYFLHYYLTFFCFDFTAHLGVSCALVTFVVGSIAVIVPTPNGAGPWHFAVKTMLILYGVANEQALFFVLIVHSVQTMLVILLGVWGWAALAFTKRRNAPAAIAPAA